VLWWIRVGTFCLAVAVALTTIALISAFSSPAKPPLGTKANPLEVHAPD
jgi:hypothetical protein